jgi:hypothetical protein
LEERTAALATTIRMAPISMEDTTLEVTAGPMVETAVGIEP